MTSFVNGKLTRKRWPRIVLIMAAVFITIIIGLVIVARRIYMENLVAVNPNSTDTVIVAIPSGTSLDEIARLLKTKHLIRADWAFKRYAISHDVSNALKAGTYRFKFSQDTGAIVKDLVDGKVAVELFTIFPASRLDQVRQEFIDKGFAVSAVDQALKPSNYAGHPALVDKPSSASLEGYLYPDSYQRTADTSVQTIITAALNEMAKALTPDVRSNIAKQGLSVYQAITLASIVEQEIPASASGDRQKAAQVFLKRVKLGMQLGSDVTAFYGAAINNQPKSVSYDTPYNTRLHSGFPPSPIGNVTADGLSAVAFPADTDYLYFVAGDDHITYFSKTLDEHQANVAQHCRLLCN